VKATPPTTTLESDYASMSSDYSSLIDSKEKDRERASQTSLVLWTAHNNDYKVLEKLLEQDPVTRVSNNWSN
jgi:hypothetical protein